MAVRMSEPGSPPEATLTSLGSCDIVESCVVAPDTSRCGEFNNSVDSDIGENTIIDVSSGVGFNKYVDCQETLVELSFIKWLSGFREECRRTVSLKNRDLFYGLLNFFHVNLSSEIVDCRNKINKSFLLKTYMEQALIFFHTYHKEFQDPLFVIYYDKMSSLLAYYIDLKIMASQRMENERTKDKLWNKKISSKISTALSIFLNNNIDLMFDAIFQLYYLFYGSTHIPVGSIMLPIFKKLLIEQHIPQELKFLTYLRYIICFKLWKKSINSSNLSPGQKRKELEQIRFTVRKLTPPHDFMEQHQKYNWPNWPKLTISFNSLPHMMNMDLKKVNMVLYTTNLSLKDCIKDILDTSRKDIPKLMKPIIEQCVSLRPDLYSVDGKEVLDAWNTKFDKTLKPLIPVTRSCNSLIRQIKYNLYNEPNNDDNINISYNLLTQDENIDTQSIINPFDLKKEIFLKRLRQNISSHNNHSIELSNTYNLIFNKKINEKKPTSRVLKTVFVNGELVPANELSKNDEMEVSVVKSKSSENYCTNKTVSNIESTHRSHSSGSSSLTKGSKRNKCFNRNEQNKRSCRSKTRHERNIATGKKNPNIGSNGQSIINRNVISNYSTLLDHSKSTMDINAMACLLNTSSPRENQWVMKSSNPETSVPSPLNLKYMHGNNISERNRADLENSTSKINNVNSDQNGIVSPSSDTQWSIKSPSELGSPGCKLPMVNDSEHMEVETVYSDNEGSQTTEHILHLRSINENENTQIYTLPMEQKSTHIEHSYVENAITSNTRDLEVVNVLSPVSINSTDIPISKSSWTPDISVHLHNDVDGDHSQSSSQLNGLCNTIGINKNRVAVNNHHSEIDHLSHMQLETTHRPRPLSSYNLIEPRLYSDDPFIASLSPNGSSVSNSGYNSIYEMARTPVSVPIKSVPVPMSSKDVIHELNDSNISIYHGNTLNLSFNGIKNKAAELNQASYNFAMNNDRPTDMSIGERVSPNNPSNINSHNILDVVSDEFSDMDSMDLRINNSDIRDINSCINNLSMSSLISSDLKTANPFNNFEKSSNWSSIKNPQSDIPNLHQKQNLKVYTDPTKLIPGPIHLNTQSEVPIHLNETRIQKAFLGNKSPSQVYYSPMADFCISSEVDIANRGSIEDSQKNNFKNQSNIRDRANTCSNDKYTHSLMTPTDNDPNGKQTSIISNYDGVHNQNSPIVNNGLLYKFNRSDNNPSVRYGSPIQLHHTNSDGLSPQRGHNGLTYTSFDQIRGQSLLEDPNLKEDPPTIINMTHLVPQSNKNCKVHYKWPLTKKKSQSTTTANEKFQEPTQSSEYKRNSNVVYKYKDDEFNLTQLQNMSPNELPNQNSSVTFNENKNDGSAFQSNQQFQGISDLSDLSDQSPVIQCGSETAEEKKQNQARIILNFENNLRKDSSDFDTLYRSSKTTGQSHEPNSPYNNDILDAARTLFQKRKLLICMYPKCTNKIHFRVIPSNAELLRHEFTVPFDDFRFNIQYKYKQLLTSTLKTWPVMPELAQLAKRCPCEVCCDFDSKLNQNQDVLGAYVEGRRRPGVDRNNENLPQIKSRITLSWKKNLANRFRSEAVAKQTITQMIDEMQEHLNNFTFSFTAVFPLYKDMKTNTEALQKACESNLNLFDNEKPLVFECSKLIDIVNSIFDKEAHLYSYQYLQLPKTVPKYVLEDKSNSPYQLANQNMSSFSHQFDEEHLPNEINRYYVENSSSPSSQSIHSNLTSPPPIRYIHENVPNTSHQSAVENLPSTSHQSSVGSITSSPHQHVLNNFPITSQCQEISLEMCSLNERPKNLSNISRYYSDGQLCSEFPPNTYLQVPSTQFPNSSTNSYYGSPVNMPSDTSVPFHSPSLSANSVPNSPSSDCSIPSLVESAATAVPEHTLLDDSLEAVNAAHNLMMISHRHRYNSTTSITSTNTTNTMTTATTNAATVSNTNGFKTKTKKISPSKTIATNNISPPRTRSNDVSIIIVTDTVQPSITEPEDQEPEVVHNSRRKKKKKHDKKKDKKKKGKR
ncbi:Hypothetical protein CINCED_3A003440 [Cinara cedri]|uniref:Uncharacterized protein n=1 Tax=Cinara cedri TaxID=506608 RepID=A0A5E4M3U0_9HEMI|nr:Hypothetical protein CINCED_3A003440 [Cinara cedri]